MEQMRPVNCDEMAELLAGYCLDALPSDESAVVEGHVAGCRDCRTLLTMHQALAEGLLYTAPPVAAPPQLEGDLRRRLAGAKAPRPKEPLSPRRAWFDRLLSPAARPALALGVVLLLTLATSNIYWLWTTTQLRTQQAILAEELEHVELDEEMLYDAMRLLAIGGRYVVLRGDAPTPQAVGTLTVGPDRPEAFLVLDTMPPLPEGKIYQLWLIDDNGRESGGVFDVEEDGDKVLVVRPRRPLATYEAVEVTLEPVGGSPSPTGPRVMEGRILFLPDR